MRGDLKKILLGAIGEEIGEDPSKSLAAIHAFGDLVLGQKDLFRTVPRRVSGWFLLEREPQSSMGDDEEFTFERLPLKGVLLHDSLHGVVGGWRAIYRSKGSRLYLFEDGTADVFTPRCQIDRDGLSFENDPWGMGISVIGDMDVAFTGSVLGTVYDTHAGAERRFVCRDLIRLLCNIRKPFDRAFLLEYAVIPPDVDILSDFSRTCAAQLWDMCLSSEFEDEVGAQGHVRCIEILSDCAGAPSATALLRYLREVSSSDANGGTALLLARMDRLEQSITGAVAEIGARFEDDEFWRKVLRPRSAIRSAFGCRLLDLPAVEAVVQNILDDFKAMVENQGLWKELWKDDEQPHREQTAQRLFYAMAVAYCKANDLDITPEANSGAGPVDFKVSMGFEGRVLVEVKLSTNDGLIHGYTTQLETYKSAECTTAGAYLVVDVGGMGSKLDTVRSLEAGERAAKRIPSKVFYVDGRKQKSASVRSARAG